MVQSIALAVYISYLTLNFICRFRNLKDEPFKEDWDTPSADYSLQLMIGFNNYERWRDGKPPGRFNLRIGPRRPGGPGMAK
jgi:hypothetical protein